MTGSARPPGASPRRACGAAFKFDSSPGFPSGISYKDSSAGPFAGGNFQALKEYASSFEEGKADVLGLYLITALSAKGELDEAKLMDGYVTFLAGILRSVRFGAGDSHGKANMVRFHFFEQMGARLLPHGHSIVVQCQ